MKLVVIVGPHAVGKMTVGQELEKLTELKLFHNHMTIDLVSNFFSYGSEEGRRLVRLFRKEIFESFAKTDLAGMIFTYIWVFNNESDWRFIEELENIFKSKGGVVFYVELEADVDKRLERNKTENRLKNKWTKRNIDWSDNQLMKSIQIDRMNSEEGEINKENYIRINNTNLSAIQVAKMIKDQFKL
jgi:shikimate kinase